MTKRKPPVGILSLLGLICFWATDAITDISGGTGEYVLYLSGTTGTDNGTTVSGYMNTTAKLAKVVFGSSRIETRNKGITFSGLVAPKSKMEIGYGSNYDDSNWYPVYLDTNGVISTNSGYYYGIRLHSTEFIYGY